MLLAQSNMSSIVQLHQWLSVVYDSAAMGLLEVTPTGIVFRAINHVETAVVELFIHSSVYFHYVRPFYVNIHLQELLGLIHGWMQDGLIGGNLIFTTEEIILKDDGNRRSIPITLSPQTLRPTSVDYMSEKQFVVEFPLPDFQNMLRELCIVGEYVEFKVTRDRELMIHTKGALAQMTYHTKNKLCKVIQDDLDLDEPLHIVISLCNMKSITLMNTSRTCRLRFVPNRVMICEVGTSDIHMITTCVTAVVA